jgi:hypothetical protein
MLHQRSSWRFPFSRSDAFNRREHAAGTPADLHIERAEEGGLKAAAELAFLPEKPSRPAREIVVVKT